MLGSIFLICLGVLAALAILALGFIMSVGAVCSRAEEDFWEKCWEGMPSIGNTFADEQSEPRELAYKKAA
jgi:hypothetical protein